MKNQWTKALYLGAIIVLSACSSGEQKDEQFCKCMEAGEQLNAYSDKMWEQEAPTSDDEKRMKELRDKKDKECKPYKTMDGAEMKRRRELCEKQ